MMLHSEGNNSTKLLLNNLTGMTTSGYIINPVNSNLETCLPVDHEVGGDPYMSFIDSDKFSPI